MKYWRSNFQKSYIAAFVQLDHLHSDTYIIFTVLLHM